MAARRYRGRGRPALLAQRLCRYWALTQESRREDLSFGQHVGSPRARKVNEITECVLWKCLLLRKARADMGRGWRRGTWLCSQVQLCPLVLWTVEKSHPLGLQVVWGGKRALQGCGASPGCLWPSCSGLKKAAGGNEIGSGIRPSSSVRDTDSAFVLCHKGFIMHPATFRHGWIQDPK